MHLKYYSVYGVSLFSFQINKLLIKDVVTALMFGTYKSLRVNDEVAAFYCIAQ